ncbi:tripartite motif-containing protein 43-like [Perognathus longimembris pacificus]|uniref:tripartite motif-containing protein 43-like n=1 Tax=Perognathus longimembris pacificus TaxID=214514 RepID=UPI002019AB11|nr:tripartite motif-containing protein 43-like [Perognathus longimembris pacificus]
MDPDIAQAFQEELSCLICMDTFINPVTLDCRHSFCQPCLCLTWEEAETPARCPVCRQHSQKKDLKPNIVLKSRASVARKASLQRSLSFEEDRCGLHKETKQMFCEVDQVLLCRLCSQSQEHKAHRHQPIDSVAEDRREMILKHMETLWKKIQENQRNINEKRNIIHEWILYANLHRGMTEDFYAVLHLGLQEEEHQYAEILINEERVILLQLTIVQTQMLQKKNHLRTVYQELMKTYRKPDVELLQDLEDALERWKCALLFMPQPLKPQLSVPLLPGLMESLQQYRVEIAFNHWIQNQHVLPDYVRNVRQDPEYAALNDEESYYLAALGSQVFSSGKHYWELILNDSSTWAVGVCRDSATGSSLTLNESEDIFLLILGKGNAHCPIFTTSPLLHHYIEKPPGWVGVFLDLDSGSVSFLNVAKNSLIWRFPTGSLQFPVRPLFLYGNPSSSRESLYVMGTLYQRILLN